MRLLYSAAVLAALLLGGTQAARASLIGDTVDLQARSPTMSAAGATDYGRQTVSATATEYSFATTGLLTADFAASTLTLTFSVGGSPLASAGATFFGFETSDLTNAFTSASLVSSNVTGFNASKLSLSNGGVFVNLLGTSFVAGQQIVIGLANGTTTTAVPEPASLALLGTGLLGLLGGRLRRRA